MAMRLVERIRFLFRIFLLFTFLAAVATISAITTIKLTIQGNQETLPDWVGVNLEIARGEAADMGLEMKVEDKLFSDKYAADKIISQEPQPGTKVKVGQHVHVLVSLGPPRIVVPDLLGSSARVAQIHWPGLETDEVVAQDPPPSTTEIRSPAINFLVSIGENTQAYVCPDFLGKRLDTVLPLVQRAGFSVSKVTPITGTAAPPGTILGQTPVPGSKISAGDSFTFQVAQGNNAAAPPASAPMVSH